MARVAIIDDERDFVELVTVILAEWGWQTLPFITTDNLLSSLRCVLPDVILLDLWLHGGVRGWDVLQALEHDPVLHMVPVVICSAATKELRAHVPELANQRVRWIEKPFDINTLYTIIAAALDERRFREFDQATTQ